MSIAASWGAAAATDLWLWAAGWWPRLRHGRGFGVHSPFAYDLITSTLRLRGPYVYYAYERLHSPHRRAVFRLAARFQPRRIATVGRVDTLSLSLAAPRAIIAPYDCQPADPDMVVVGRGVPDPQGAAHWLSRRAAAGEDVAVVFTHLRADRRLWRAAVGALDRAGHGMTFSNQRTLAVTVHRSSLPRQDFLVRM